MGFKRWGLVIEQSLCKKKRPHIARSKNIHNIKAIKNQVCQYIVKCQYAACEKYAFEDAKSIRI